jgi:MFS family permease
LGIFAIPPLAALLISRYGWHFSYLLFGASTLLLLNVLARFMHRDPKELGLQPDGGPQPINSLKPIGGGKTPRPRAVEMDVSDAIRTQAFWCLTASIVAGLFTIPIPYVHLVSHAQDLGLPPLAASTLISMIGAFSLVGNLSLGPVSDRIGRKVTLGICMFLAVLAFFGFAKAWTASGLYAAAAAFGLYYGAAAICFPAIVGDFFGREHAGALTGIIFAMGGPAVALGPVVAGWIYDRTGGYYLAFLLSAMVSAASLVILIFARAPEEHPDTGWDDTTTDERCG